MPDITREFRQHQPGRAAGADLPDLARPARQILQDEIDLGFIEGPFQSSEIESRPVARHKLMALLPPQHPLDGQDASSPIEDLAGENLVMGTSAEWPTFRRIVVDAFQSAGQVLSVGQEASSLTGILGLVTAGVGITVFCGMPRFCGEHIIVPRPIVTQSARAVETHLAWRRASISVRHAPLHRDEPEGRRAYMAP